MIHENPSPLAGTTQTLKPNVKGIGGKSIQVEDWYDRVHDQPWKGQEGNKETQAYAYRAGMSGLPANDEVVYGKIDDVAYIVNVLELAVPM